MSTTVDNAITQGGTFDPNNTNALATDAIASSAPPYIPIIGSGYTLGSDGVTKVPLVNSITGTLTSEAEDPNFKLPASESFTSKPIISTPQDTLTNNVNLSPIDYQPTAQATATYAGVPNKTAATGYTPAQGVAVQGTVTPQSLVQNQFKYVMNDNTNSAGVPEWAQPAVSASNQRLNSLGLGASTMAGDAETGAILTAALPIAEQNAHTYALMNTQNVTNEQYTMLANTSAKNAAYNFNAKNQQQNDQFFANLTDAAILQNANNATSVSKYNAGQKNAVNDFQANLNNTRDEFNASNQLVIDQSNVKWQRSINTANTANENAANQANVKNTFNVQQGALNDLWLQARDEASWSLTSSENSQNRALSLVNSSMNRQTSYGILNSQLSSSMYTQLGNFGVSLLGGTSGISSGISSVGKYLFGSSSDSGKGTTTSGGDFGGGTDSSILTSAQGGPVTRPVSNGFASINQSPVFNDSTMANGVDLTHNTPHVSTDDNYNNKLTFDKYK